MRAFTLLVAAVAAFSLSMPAAAAAPAADDPDPWACWFAPSPGSGWSLSPHGYPTCDWCEAAGEAGVERGDWEAFRCAFVPIGLDGDYFIFLPTEPAPSR